MKKRADSGLQWFVIVVGALGIAWMLTYTVSHPARENPIASAPAPVLQSTSPGTPADRCDPPPTNLSRVQRVKERRAYAANPCPADVLYGGRSQRLKVEKNAALLADEIYRQLTKTRPASINRAAVAHVSK